jgi:hypothetical protein
VGAGEGRGEAVAALAWVRRTCGGHAGRICTESGTSRWLGVLACWSTRASAYGTRRWLRISSGFCTDIQTLRGQRCQWC